MDRRRFLVAGASAPLAAGTKANAPERDRTLRVAFPSPETGFDPAQVQDMY